MEIVMALFYCSHCVACHMSMRRLQWFEQPRYAHMSMHVSTNSNFQGTVFPITCQVEISDLIGHPQDRQQIHHRPCKQESTLCTISCGTTKRDGKTDKKEGKHQNRNSFSTQCSISKYTGSLQNGNATNQRVHQCTKGNGHGTYC